jgi:hypothetical protein
MSVFVWAKMQAEAGEPLEQIVLRKEAERKSGDGAFWWGFGASLGDDVEQAAVANGFSLPVLFSKMLSPPKKKDSAPEVVWLWDAWETKKDRSRLPPNVLVTGGSGPPRSHYALVCQSDVPLRLLNHGIFDPKQCCTYKSRNDKGKGKVPGPSQVTSLLWNRQPSAHKTGDYRTGFRATLTRPWTVKLAHPRQLSAVERAMIKDYREGDDWMSLARAIRK